MLKIVSLVISAILIFFIVVNLGGLINEKVFKIRPKKDPKKLL